MAEKFRVGLTRDFLTPEGELAFRDIGLGLLDDNPNVEYEFFPELRSEVTPDQIRDYDAVIAYVVNWTAASFQGVERLALVVRFGVGYDMVDVGACTENDVILAITPSGVRTPMAEGSLTLMLALAKQIIPKEKILRENRWMDHKLIYGSCLANKVVGTVGVGNIGGELMRLLAPFRLSARLAYDPYCSPELAAELGVELVELDRLLSDSDFVAINCPLTEQTHKLIGPDQLNRMKPTAYLVNASRGPIVDQAALTASLREKKIAGAALDVFEQEPIASDDPLLELDNVILLPHAVGWTDEALYGNGAGCCLAALNVAEGKAPETVVNREVLDRPGLQAKLDRWR